MTKKPSTNEKFKSGAVRQKTTGQGRYDLLSPFAIHRLALVFEKGAKKYGDRNWEKGIPAENLIDHALRHIFAYMAGEKDEDHIAHAAWNLLAIIHFEELFEEEK